MALPNNGFVATDCPCPWRESPTPCIDHSHHRIAVGRPWECVMHEHDSRALTGTTDTPGTTAGHDKRTLHERAMSLTEASVALRRRLTPHPSECPVNDSGAHETYGLICHCGWSYNDPGKAGGAIAPTRQELTVMLVEIEDEARATILSDWEATRGALATVAQWDSWAAEWLAKHPLASLRKSVQPTAGEPR